MKLKVEIVKHVPPEMPKTIEILDVEADRTIKIFELREHIRRFALCGELFGPARPVLFFRGLQLYSGYTLDKYLTTYQVDENELIHGKTIIYALV